MCFLSREHLRPQNFKEKTILNDLTPAEEKSFGIIAQHGGNHSVFMHKTPPFLRFFAKMVEFLFGLCGELQY